ncbi:hypothetical protein [Paenibacillus melissococcoides]|nr:hypothetical protein [Paenibacillus melissococcoides]
MQAKNRSAIEGGLIRGGVYKDTDFAKVNYHVRSIEKEDGYGEQG